MVAQDDIDTECLQAQVDMSMAFAHSLVTSWIKPARVAQLRSSGVNATQILDEELRRPPRLGVGASVPPGLPLSHEASRLKRRLRKNGIKVETVMESQSVNSSRSDEEEHKGRPVKRKVKADPFGHESKKKKRTAELTTTSCPSGENVFEQSASLLEQSISRKLANSSFKKEEQQFLEARGQCSAAPVSSWPVRLPVQATVSSSLTDPTVPPPLEASREIYAPDPGKPAASEFSRAHVPSPCMPEADRVKLLLLNLDGPPEPTVKAGNISKSHVSKKKRKRRKKKIMVTSTGDN